MARKTKAAALATRHQILDAAERLFCARGVARTSLHEIAESIELTRGAVYWHFRDKYDLLLALWERAVLPIDEAFDALDADAAMQPVDRIREKALRLFGRIVHDDRTRNLLMILLLRCEMVDEVAAARQHILGCRDECLGKMAEEFAAAVARGQLQVGIDPTTAAIGLHSMIDGLAYHWLLEPTRFDLEVVGATIVDGWLAGMRTTRQAKGRAAPERQVPRESRRRQSKSTTAKKRGAGSSS